MSSKRGGGTPSGSKRRSSTSSNASNSSSVTPTPYSHSTLNTRSAMGSVSNPHPHGHAHAKHGTVGALRPTPVVPLDAASSVYEAACYMASRRVDAVLVAAPGLPLAGIATDKDLVYRVVAAGLDPRTTSLRTIMTHDPVKVLLLDSATHALNSMISGHFRHLPVLDRPLASGGSVVGLLDVTKCLYDSLEKLETVYSNSRQAALLASKDVPANPSAPIASTAEAAMAKYAEILRHQLAGPNLSTLLATESAIPPVAEMRDTVAVACQRMKEGKETAVLVFDSEGGTAGSATEEEEEGLGNLCGIFTSKDLVLRVLAAGLDPQTTPVSRVMTPHPECVTPETPVLEALRKMHIGRYLHLPVIDSQGVIEGLVDVLKLTYTTLDQLSQVKGSGPHGDGPVWDRFWEDAGSVVSHTDSTNSRSRPTGAAPAAARNRDLYRQTSTTSKNYIPYTGGPAGARERQNSTTTIPDDGGSIYPDDSASVIAGEHHGQPAHMHALAGAAASRPASSMSTGAAHAAAMTAASAAIPAGSFAFKLRDFEARTTHRFTCSSTDLAALQALVASKMRSVNANARVCYIDDEGDVVRLETDADLVEAVEVARRAAWGRVVLMSETQRRFVEGGRSTGVSDVGTAISSFKRGATASSVGTPGVPTTYMDEEIGERMTQDVTQSVDNSRKDGSRIVRLEEIEHMEAMVAPALVGAGIAVVCAFLLGRAFK